MRKINPHPAPASYAAARLHRAKQRHGDFCLMYHVEPRTSGFQKCMQKPELLPGDFKRFTSKAVVKAIIDNPRESRKVFLLDDVIVDK